MRLTLDNLPTFCIEYDGCLLWGRSVNSLGYPQARIDGKPGQMVRRHVFRDLLGKQLRPGQRVSSRCGDRLCVAPACLVARSPGAIQREAYRSGRRSTEREYMARHRLGVLMSGSTMTWEIADQIRREPAHLAHTEVARKYGLGATAVSKIRRGVSWRRPKLPVRSVFELGSA